MGKIAGKKKQFDCSSYLKELISMAQLFFPKSTLNKMAGLGLSEADVQDVYNHGDYKKLEGGGNMSVKKYSSYGYEIGIFYTQSSQTSDYVVTHVWKKDRR